MPPIRAAGLGPVRRLAGRPAARAGGLLPRGKVQGKWWLVDPEGRLFFSHGIDCVRAREHHADHGPQALVRRSPRQGLAAGGVLRPQAWAPHGYYQGKRLESFNFPAANLLRKYGTEWRQRFRRMSTSGCAAGALNTIANWSDGRRLPAAPDALHAPRSRQRPADGRQRRLLGQVRRRVRSELCRRPCAAAMAGRSGRLAGDAWCLGYFSTTR